MPDPAEVIASAVGTRMILRQSTQEIAAGVLAALAEAGYSVIPSEGAATEWGVRSGSDHVQKYRDEDDAASWAQVVNVPASVVSRQVGPWTEVPETKPGEDGSHG